jgi:alanine or glycine:cation symporter, AGCS family
MSSIFQTIEAFISNYNEYIGGYLILALLVPTGIYLSIRLNFLQVSSFMHAIRVVRGKFDKKDDIGDVSHFKALTTALSSTVGTGNIVGVALAIYWGGPGAIFWMWVTGFFGMMLKMVECTLALKYRKINKDGTVSGGPMYYIEQGLKSKLGGMAKVLAVIFAVATVLCSLGTGNMAQANSISDVMFTNYKIPVLYTGIIISLLVLLIIVGGLKRIAEVTVRLVPFMAVFYLLASFTVLFVYSSGVHDAFRLIFSSAFSGTAVTGGFLGSTFMMTLVMGVRRGLFSNEAGQGSAAIAHAAAKTEYPVREGMVASLEPFIDTICICTLTALVIILSGAWSSGIQGVGMTILAFESGFSQIGLPGVSMHIIAAGLLMFAFSTIISWSYYGTRGIQYVLGDKFIKPYYYAYGLFVFFGSIWGIEIVWSFVDMVITFMTIPNLIALVLLFPVMRKEVRDYIKTKKENRW